MYIVETELICIITEICSQTFTPTHIQLISVSSGQVWPSGANLHWYLECSLYVTYVLIVYRSKYIHIIEHHLQLSLNVLSHRADTNGFKFSSSKTVCMHFYRRRSAHTNPELTLNGTLIPVVEQSQFFGVIFDNKLTFLPHIRYLKEKCVMLLNLQRVVVHTSWGADQQTLLHLYRSLVRSKLDYGSVVYGSARKSYLRILDHIQNHAFLGAFRTSPSSRLCVQAKEPPLYILYVFPQTRFIPDQSGLQHCLEPKIQGFFLFKT